MGAVTYTRETAPAISLDLTLWPKVDLQSLDEAERKRAEALQVAVEAYVRGETMAPLLASVHLCHAQLLRAFNKCILPAPDGQLFGYRGLLLQVGRKPYERVKAATAKSTAGALHLMFKRIRGLEKRLRDAILRRDSKGKLQEARIRAKDLHRTFISELRQAGVGDDEWPFNTRWKGKRCIERYMQNVVTSQAERAVRVRYGEAAGSKYKTGTGHRPLMLAIAPYDVAEMDAHRLDLIGSVRIPTHLGVLTVPINRMQILLIGDCTSTGVLGYYVVIRRECASEDLLFCAERLVKPWSQRKLRVEGMTYQPGSGLPFGVVDGLGPSGIGVLKVDRALVNLGWAVVDRIANRLGCAVNWGPPRTWARRALIERINASLEQNGFQRTVSTLGAHHRDPRRRDPVRAAVEHEVDVEVVLDAIDVVLADANIQPTEGAFGLTPLRSIAQMVQGIAHPTLIPLLPKPDALHPELDVLFVNGTLRGDLKTGHRTYLKYKRVRYTNPVIASMPHLIGQDVVLHVRAQDVRTLEVYLRSTGESLGVVTAMGKWAARPHSLEMRIQIFRHIDDGRLVIPDGMDPITATHQFLARKTRAAHQPNAPKVSPSATVLARESVVTQRPITGEQPRKVAASGRTPLRSRRAPVFNHFKRR